MIKISNSIKVVFWDLDDTLWKGTLAEKESVQLFDNRVEIIKQLNKRGIVNSICSKNDYDTAKQILTSFGIWDLFVFPQISFQAKGMVISEALKEMGLRDTNALFVDDNVLNLNEALYYNPQINVIIADKCDNLLDLPELKGKDDATLSRYSQYKMLEKKADVAKKSSSNEDFLRESNIRIEFLEYEQGLHERLCELIERTNQLNYTKNRMNSNQLLEMISDNLELKLIHVVDNFGDYGIVGFYALKDNKLIHFVFSCRIMNMGIEQFVYAHLGYPELKVVGEVASEVSSSMKVPDYITVLEPDNCELFFGTVDDVLKKESRLNIFSIGACDLFHPIAYFSMPNQYFIYECNVFKGAERGVNVGTEYIRSHFDMSETEKSYCKKHFFNYTGTLAFNSQIFAQDWDYVIMSFHDDMIYKVYENKCNPNIRVILSPEKKFGLTSVICVDDESSYPIDEIRQKEWLATNFNEGEYISEERFIDNVKWISSEMAEHTKIILVTGPEMDFFREHTPHCPEARAQIIKINNAIYRLARENPSKFAVVDINRVICTKDDVTDYVFHLKAQTAYKLFKNIAYEIISKFSSRKKKMLSSVLKEREVIIFGNTIEAENAYINLQLGGHVAIKCVHTVGLGRQVGYMLVENWEQIVGCNDKYYIVIADTENADLISMMLMCVGYRPMDDFIQLKPHSYQKIWNEQ